MSSDLWLFPRMNWMRLSASKTRFTVSARSTIGAAVRCFERLLLGASVECGTHIAELEEMDEGPIRTTRLVLS